MAFPFVSGTALARYQEEPETARVSARRRKANSGLAGGRVCPCVRVPRRVCDRRGTSCTGLALLLLAGVFLLTDRLVYPPGPTERNVKRVREGMTLPTVERLRGGARTGRSPSTGVGGGPPARTAAYEGRRR